METLYPIHNPVPYVQLNAGRTRGAAEDRLPQGQYRVRETLGPTWLRHVPNVQHRIGRCSCMALRCQARGAPCGWQCWHVSRYGNF